MDDSKPRKQGTQMSTQRRLYVMWTHSRLQIAKVLRIHFFTREEMGKLAALLGALP